jgi:hypothetical protein
MIKNREVLQEFEDETAKRENVDVLKNIRIVEAMYREAVLLDVLPLRDPLSGIEIDIKIAKVLNSVSSTP